MPGPEQAVLIREVIVLRVTPESPFDSCFLLSVLSLKVVRDQGRRVIFVQTIREDVGHRYKEILLPIPFGSRRRSSRVEEFRTDFTGLSRLRTDFADRLKRTA